MSDAQDEFLTVAEIAARLKLNSRPSGTGSTGGELPALRVGARRVRVRSADLERFIATSSSAKIHTKDEARVAFGEALASVQGTSDDRELVPALRTLARASADLARALSS